MSEQTWHLSDLEFLVLRERVLRSDLPYPFTYVNPKLTTYLEFERLKSSVWRSLQSRWDPDLVDVLTEAARPEVRVQVRTWHSADMGDTSQRYFLIANRCGERAILIQGYSDHTVDTFDRYRIVEAPAESLSGLVVGALPEMTAGSQSRVDLVTYHQEETVDHWSNRGFYDSGDNDVDRRSQSWQQAAQGLVGIIEIRQGRSRFGPRNMRLTRLFWEDHPGDGRYLIDLTPPMAAIGIDAAAMRNHIDRAIADTLLVVQDESRELMRESVFDN
ncbi:ESX secretion-associated protein EspG [Nocardia sp. alder85J]|uniref:ESX secretion-associated protein EspG n=1 Tax=Nocardia sp. alder85J TaxID=2862949 RepID=UPI001CD801A4|nr:ESX secretion-associated protein EspG [Nocardia sp. alder85J]MCX4093075.1 ESX secretion-associated protein EspG [Nocardia sp. alder85J]